MNKRIAEWISWLRTHEKTIVYGAGVVVIGMLCFVFGVLKGTGLSQEPVVVVRPETPPVTIPCNADSREEVVALTVDDCKYVGSIKGKKYYPPSCSYAKNIAKENLRCFVSDEDAVQKGYEKSTSCK